MPRAGSICFEAGCPEPATYRGRCATHARQEEKRLKATTPTKIAGSRAAEQLKRSKAVADHRARFGNWCPGWEQPPHYASDLTAQHSHALAAGGDVNQELAVLCRACNSRHGARMRHQIDRL